MQSKLSDASIKKKLKQKKAVFFLVFLALSCVLWFLIKLSGSYSSMVTFYIDYENVPKDKLVLGKPVGHIKVLAEGNGFNLLYSKFIRVNKKIDLSDVKTVNNKTFLLRDDLEEQFRKQTKKLTIRKVLLDTVFISLGVNKKKFISVKPILDISFQKDYEPYDSIYVIPQKIWIEGDESVVDTISSITTGKIVLNNVNKDIDVSIALKVPDYLKKANFQTKSVTLKGSVARFSEKIVRLPVEVENLPSNISIRIFPPEIELLCKATINDLKKLSPNDFKIVCDYSLLDANSSFFVPKVAKKPSSIREVRFLQAKVEYLINRK